ncbi:MAG: glycosyltransferase family 39 protein [Cyanobacteria bacterium P01_A01_bin.37]
MKWVSSRPLPIALLLVVITTGVFFRVVRLDHKVYWHDEVFTSIRAAGYVGQGVGEALYTGDVLYPKDILKYQTLEPGRGWSDTLHALTTHPEHPPLYYLLVRLWMNLFGTSVAVIRSLSVLFSLLTFPALYWLCLELFRSPSVGWMAIALYSVSPFHVLYAQEARQYSLWTLTTILSSTLLLRALEKGSVSRWVSYVGAIALGFYTSLFSVLVYGAHAAYVLMRESWQFNKTVVRFSIALIIGSTTFIPWAIVMVNNWDTFKAKTSWVNYDYPLSLLTRLWGLHVSSALIDMGFPLYHWYSVVAPIGVILLIAFAFYRLIRNTPQRTWLFVLFLTVLPAIALIFPDLMLGGRRSASTRYFVPVLIGVLLAGSFLLSEGISHLNGGYRWIIRGLVAVILTVGIVSCSISFHSDTWWSKVVSYGVPRTAALVNSKPKPLLIVGLRDVSLGNTIALSYRLDDHVRLQMTLEANIPDIPNDVSDLFLYHPTDALLQVFKDAPKFRVQDLKRDSMYIINDSEDDAT